MIHPGKAANLIALAVVATLAVGAPARAGDGASGRQAPIMLAQAEGSAGNGAAAAGAAGACVAPHRYVDLINAGKYDEIGGLFANDAVYMGPDGKTRHGSKAIGEFYTQFLGALKPRVKAVSFVEAGDNCVMELANHDRRTGKYSLVAIDHFTIDKQGRIARFIVYLRPGERFSQTINAALAKVH